MLDGVGEREEGDGPVDVCAGGPAEYEERDGDEEGCYDG